MHVAFDDSPFPALDNLDSSSEDKSESFFKNVCWTESAKFETSFPDNRGKDNRESTVKAETSNAVLDTDEASSSSLERETKLDKTEAGSLERRNEKWNFPRGLVLKLAPQYYF